jgi:hypothetical protein
LIPKGLRVKSWKKRVSGGFLTAGSGVRAEFVTLVCAHVSILRFVFSSVKVVRHKIGCGKV